MMLSRAPLKLITDAALVHPDGAQSTGTVLIEDGYIRSISPQPPAALLLNRDDVEIYSAAGQFLTPGLIELHFNGAFGCDLNQTNLRQAQTLMQRLPSYGITSAVLTAITAPLTDMLSAINTLAAVIHHQNASHCQALGLHLEGPFISPFYPGVHPKQDILPMSLDDLNVLLSPMTRMITMAPEVDPDGQAIRYLAERGVRVSMGHSNATFEQVKQAMLNGATSVTHLFNAMRPLHHREPGIIGTAIADDRLFVQIIGDGAHLHPETIRAVLRGKPSHKVLLASDASPAAGMPDGSEVRFAGQTMTVQKQQTINHDGVLGGSSQLITDCVRNLVKWGLADFPTAIRYATANPADFLGEQERGKIAVGCRADLVLWEPKTLAVSTTFIAGEVVFQREQADALAQKAAS